MIELSLWVQLRLNLNKVISHISCLRSKISLQVDNIFLCIFNCNNNWVSFAKEINFGKIGSFANISFINTYLRWGYLTRVRHNINSRHSTLLLIISSSVFIPSVGISWTMPVIRLYKSKLNEFTIIEFIIYFIRGKGYFKVTVWVSSLELRRLKISWLINLLKNKHILSTHKGWFKDKSAGWWGRIAEYLMSLITKNFIADSTWKYDLYSLFLYCSFMDHWKINNVLLRVYCAFISWLIEIASLRRSSLHFRDYLYDLCRFTLHFLLKSSLDVIFRSSSDAIMMLHYR